MATRLSPEPEMVPLIRALRTRIDSLKDAKKSLQEGVEVYARDSIPFLGLEIKRDHMILDLWLEGDAAEECRASGLGRIHPFAEGALKVRFERAQDLAKVSRWLETSYKQTLDRKAQEIAGVQRPQRQASTIRVAPPRAAGAA